eukprot:7870580-Ditylum_brightwellii.AAC.1
MAENKGDTLTYWILADNQQVLACSLVHPVNDAEINPHTLDSGESKDQAVVEIEGSKPEKKSTLPSLDLLLEMVNSPMPEFDPSDIDGFDASKHIGLEFIRKDKYEVPTKAKVIEVDDETGKVMLEYIHGGLEVVGLNIIQESFLSKAQQDDADGFWMFSKVLNYCVVSNGKIEVEIIWNNGEVS